MRTVDPNDLSESQKRRMSGMCCFNLLGLVATAAFLCAISSYAYCDFATRKVTLKEGFTIDEVCSSTGYDGITKAQCEALLNTHGVGFDGFWITVPVDTKVCYPYTLITPWGYQTPDMDTKFNSARALSITGIVLGGAAWFTLMLASCCKLDQSKLNGLACYFFLATLFQGLSLLIFRSNVCTVGFFSVYFTEPGTAAPTTMPDWMESVSCSLSKGSKLAISATVLWFVCSSMLPAAVVPEPLWRGGEQEFPPGTAPTGGDDKPAEAGGGVEQAGEEA
eukprot:CAMPEP_0202012202 /NCGR_PEP_ID=MMETSP0905-20130828/22599_1 /ASSEMBLY_ACC=CAM_ASM_000554 /TAXON_ID=420261 /ORGANISM="Thalassiosira antarctica, Strain CCMP982" /LENGTH=277 /DNA_ID=CAMNT_0048571345 /DNA_START=18 /DNA_END=851 /DNA_ORIENTATION=-